jgi:hypothetical protein
VTVLQPFRIVDHRGDPGFDAIVIAIDRSILADFAVLESHGFLLGDENIDIRAERALVAFQRENVIGLFVDNLLRDIALAPRLAIPSGCARRNLWPALPIASMVTIAPSIASIFKSLGIAMISLDFSATLTCPSTRRRLAEGRNHVDRSLTASLVRETDAPSCRQ